MGNQTSTLVAETEALRESYAALNRNDIPAAVAIFDPQIESTEPNDYPEGGTTRGLADVTALFTRARGTWAEGSCEPERFIAAGDKVVALCRVRVRLNDRVEWIDGRLADVHIFRNGKVIQRRTFDEASEALVWAGIDPSKAD